MAINEIDTSTWGNGNSLLESIPKILANFGLIKAGAPQKPASSAGAGQWTAVSAGNTATLALPAGGNWGYFLLVHNDDGTFYNAAAGVAAGETVIYAETTKNKTALCWRVD